MTALLLILDTLTKFLVGVFLIRFILQLVRADFYNPISQAIVSITNPLVMPLRKFIPGFKGMDMASLVAAFAVQIIAVYLIHFVRFGGSILPIGSALLMALISFINLILGMYLMLIFLRVILSWVNPDPRNPMVSLLFSLTEPVMAPARRLIPPLGGLDLSPILVLLAISTLRVLINQDLIPALLH